MEDTSEPSVSWAWPDFKQELKDEMRGNENTGTVQEDTEQFGNLETETALKAGIDGDIQLRTGLHMNPQTSASSNNSLQTELIVRYTGRSVNKASRNCDSLAAKYISKPLPSNANNDFFGSETSQFQLCNLSSAVDGIANLQGNTGLISSDAVLDHLEGVEINIIQPEENVGIQSTSMQTQREAKKKSVGKMSTDIAEGNVTTLTDASSINLLKRLWSSQENPVKKKRGRPRKVPLVAENSTIQTKIEKKSDQSNCFNETKHETKLKDYKSSNSIEAELHASKLKKDILEKAKVKYLGKRKIAQARVNGLLNGTKIKPNEQNNGQSIDSMDENNFTEKSRPLRKRARVEKLSLQESINKTAYTEVVVNNAADYEESNHLNKGKDIEPEIESQSKMFDHYDDLDNNDDVNHDADKSLGEIENKSLDATRKDVVSTLETCLANRITQFKLKYCTKPCSLKLHRVETVYKAYGHLKIDLFPIQDEDEDMNVETVIIGPPERTTKVEKAAKHPNAGKVKPSKKKDLTCQENKIAESDKSEVENMEPKAENGTENIANATVCEQDNVETNKSEFEPENSELEQSDEDTPDDDLKDKDFNPWEYVQEVLGEGRGKRKCSANQNLNEYHLEELNIDESILMYENEIKIKKQRVSKASCENKGENQVHSRKVRKSKPKVERVPQDPCKCRYCEFVGQGIFERETHYEIVHRKAKCMFCDKILLLESYSYFAHMSRFHGAEKKYKCDFEGCDHASAAKADLEKHRARTHSTEYKYVCDLCDYKSNYSRNVESHKLLRHSDIRNFPCGYCEYSAKRSQDLKQHMLRHSEERPLKCDQCDYTCKRHWAMSCHKTKHSNVRPFKCGFPGCSMAMKTRSDLLKHRKTHKVVRDFICTVCEKGFKCQVSLNKHVRHTHVNERIYGCDICGKMFKSKIVLRCHLQCHTDIKPFKCKVCGHRCRTKFNLEIHQATHDFSSRPYMCPLCPYAVSDPMNLLPHIGAYHSEYCFFCELCRKPFQRYSHLQNHLSREIMHSAEEVAKMRSSADLDLSGLKSEIEEYVVETETQDDFYAQIANSSVILGERKREQSEQPTASVSSQPVSAQDEMDNANENTCDDTDADLESASIGEPTSEEIETGQLSTVKLEPQEQPNKDLVEMDENVDAAETDFQNDEDDKKAISEGKKIVAVGVYGDIRISIATRGFPFNYDKNGKKPDRWFMDYRLMKKKDAEKQKKYLRRLGVLPPLKRGHPPKGYKRLSSFLKKRRKKFEENKRKRVSLGLSRGRCKDVSLTQQKVKKEADEMCVEFETAEGKTLTANTVGETVHQKVRGSGNVSKVGSQKKVKKRTKTKVKKSVQAKMTIKSKKTDQKKKSVTKKKLQVKVNFDGFRKSLKDKSLKITVGHKEGKTKAVGCGLKKKEGGKKSENVLLDGPKYKYVPVKPPRKGKQSTGTKNK